jgi:hypothetical protein
MSDTALIKELARTLRYRELSELIGRVVYIKSVGTIGDDVRDSLGSAFPKESRLVAPEPRFIRTALLKWTLDLTFNVWGEFFDVEYERGIPLLKKLGFLAETEFEEIETELGNNSDDLTDMTGLIKELEQGKTVIRLLLKAEPPRFPPGLIIDPNPGFPLPREFIIKDACVTNSGFVWFHKHFYL